MRNTRVLYRCTGRCGRDGVGRKTVATRGGGWTRVAAGGAVSCVRLAPTVEQLFTADLALAYDADCWWWWRSRTGDGAVVASLAGSVPVRRRYKSAAWAWNRGGLVQLCCVVVPAAVREPSRNLSLSPKNAHRILSHLNSWLLLIYM